VCNGPKSHHDHDLDRFRNHRVIERPRVSVQVMSLLAPGIVIVDRDLKGSDSGVNRVYNRPGSLT
jgi:hypothetical protein